MSIYHKSTKSRKNIPLVKLVLVVTFIFIKGCSGLDSQSNQENLALERIEKNKVENIQFINSSILEKGMLYSEARKSLIDAGWQPAKLNSILDCEYCEQGSTRIQYFVRKLNYTEISACSGTGLGFCRFDFQNKKGDMLYITTINNDVPYDEGGGPTVWSWQKDNQVNQ